MVTKTVTVTLHDTTVVVKPDSSAIRMLLECDSAGNVLMKELLWYQSGKHLKPPALNITDNILTATAQTDSIGIYLLLKTRFETFYADNIQTDTKIVEVNVLTRWQKFRLWIANLVLIIGPLWLFFKLKNKVRWVKRE